MDAEAVLEGPHTQLCKQRGFGGANLVSLLDQVDGACDLNGTLVDLGWNVQSLHAQTT